MSVSQQEAARELLARRRARRSLLAFTEYTTPAYQAGRIHREIAEACERVLDGEIDRLLITCPPQHGKSEIISRNLPAYLLGREPTRDIISVSAEAELARGFGRDVRNRMRSPEYANVFDTRMSEDSTAKGRWSTQEGGSYYAVGIGGSLFGRGGSAVIDDPFKSWEDAQSELARDRVWQWYTGTLYNRVRPGNFIIVIQHRMHEDDLVGKLLEASERGGDKWHVVNLPADLDDPPWEERYDREALERIKANTSPMQWASLYMGEPSPEEGAYFKREWFWRFEPDEAPGRKFQTADFAVTDEADADDPDFTEVGVHSVSQKDGQYRIHLCVDGWSGRKAPDEWVDAYFNLVKRHKPMCEFAEVGVIRRAVEGLLDRQRRARKAYGRIEWVSHIGDKSANARALQAMASMGLVGIANTEYGDRVLEQLIKFPMGKHDDAVDMCALMARAVDEAHPMMERIVEEKQPKRDLWGRVQREKMDGMTL